MQPIATVEYRPTGEVYLLLNDKSRITGPGVEVDLPTAALLGITQWIADASQRAVAECLGLHLTGPDADATPVATEEQVQDAVEQWAAEVRAQVSDGEALQYAFTFRGGTKP